PRPPCSTLFPYTTLFRSRLGPMTRRAYAGERPFWRRGGQQIIFDADHPLALVRRQTFWKHQVSGIGFFKKTHQTKIFPRPDVLLDRKSTRLNSSHRTISY